MTKYFAVILFIMIGSWYSDNQPESTTIEEVVSEVVPAKVVCLQPMGNVSAHQLDVAKEYLSTHFPELDIYVGAPVELPKSAFNGRRYRGDSLIRFLRSIKPAEASKIIGITTKDISTTRTLVRDGKKIVYSDYGILGIGFMGGPSCVVSSYRMSSDNMFGKTVVHEFMHTLKVHHCKHENCIMQDGNGSGKNMRESTHIHSECKNLALENL